MYMCVYVYVRVYVYTTMKDDDVYDILLFMIIMYSSCNVDYR